MTPEELRERYPLESIWRLRVADVRSLATTNQGLLTADYTVVGWREGIVVLVDHCGNTAQIYAELMPPPTVVCPITEPVTLHSYTRSGDSPGYGSGGPFDENGGYPPITLHPPRDGESYGRWTWEGGPE